MLLGIADQSARARVGSLARCRSHHRHLHRPHRQRPIVRAQGFPARLRIKQRREFLRVQRGGRKHHVRHFMVFAKPLAGVTPSEPSLPPTLPPTRLGITVTRKVGNAVVRNRIKRMVREVFRQNRERLPAGLDLVWVAKQQAAEASYADVLADFEALVRRGDLTGPEPQRGQRPR